MRTLTILVWLVFAIKFTGLILTYLSRIQDRFEFIQARTLPLMKNQGLRIIDGDGDGEAIVDMGAYEFGDI